MNEYTWFEVWVDETARPPYVLLLLSNEKEDALDIFDPVINTVRHSTTSYREAMLWLTEDEYTKVDGRMAL